MGGVNRTRVALVGYGRWGRVLEGALDSHPAFELMVIHHPSSVGNGRTTPHVADALDDDAIAAVVIAAPLVLRPDLVAQCLEAGKHVLTEKPLAGSLAGARQLAVKARSHGLTLMTDFTHAYGPTMDLLLELIDGEDPLEVVVRMTQPGPLVRAETAATVLGSHALAITGRLLRAEETEPTWDSTREVGPNRWRYVGRVDSVIVDLTADLGHPILRREVEVITSDARWVADLAGRMVDELHGDELSVGEGARARRSESAALSDELYAVLGRFRSAIEGIGADGLDLSLWVQAQLDAGPES